MNVTCNWFEIPVVDFERACRFYSGLYDTAVERQESGPNVMGIFPGSPMAGAIVQGPRYVPSERGSLVYLGGGDDLQVVLDRVTGLGGDIILPKTSIGEHGFVAQFRDTEGNKVALHSPA